MTVLVVGEALVDVVTRRTGVVDRHPGGSPANMAVGLARLGHDVTFATRIGPDADGSLLRRHLEADGVRLAEGSLVPERTSTATAVLDDHGGATYEFDVDWRLPPVDLTGVTHVHAGSIGAALPPGSEEVQRLLHAARAAGITTSYDPNLRPALIGPAEQERPVVERLVGGVDVVKASDEDVAWLCSGGRGRPADPIDAAADWARQGPRLVVLTRGAAGAIAWLGGELGGQPDAPIDVPAPTVAVVDTVGAGDAFMAGLLSGLLDQGMIGQGIIGQGIIGQSGRASAPPPWSPDDVLPALRRALTVASLTCARPGADPPRRGDI